MADGMYRIAVVGAGSLKGKELADELGESLLAASSVTLLGEEEESGTIATAGDEPAVIQGIESDSFARMDFAFFCGTAAETETHWHTARLAGASVVDQTFALESVKGVPVRAPWVREALRRGGVMLEDDLHLGTTAMVAAHPAAVMLGLLAARLQSAMPVKALAATVVEPASQHGREAMDELHQQTVNLLGFQNLPRERYDAQVAFNVLPELGEGSAVKLSEVEERILRHYRLAGGGKLPPLDVEMVQAPVFHGYVMSVLVELGEAKRPADVEAALAGDWVDVVAAESDPPSNLSAAGQDEVMVRVKSTGGVGATANRFWLWLAADNLKLGAQNAIACALELGKLRPRGKIQ